MFRSYLYIQTTTAPIPYKRTLSALDFQHYFFEAQKRYFFLSKQEIIFQNDQEASDLLNDFGNGQVDFCVDSKLQKDEN